VKTWFDQPGKKKSRSLARARKAARIFPRPVSGLLRPQVQCPTFKYNSRSRLGRGFTLAELRGAGVQPRQARTIGIAVDRRRFNKSNESLQRNIARLKEYKSKLILFPRNSKKPKKGDASKEEISKVTQLKTAVLPLPKKEIKTETYLITKADRNLPSAFATYRQAKANARLLGRLKKRAADKAAANQSIGKK
jgi:large subunit ribosomal protein L13e